MSGEDPLLSSHTGSLCPQVVEGARELSEVSFTKALIPFMRAFPHDLITVDP